MQAITKNSRDRDKDQDDAIKIPGMCKATRDSKHLYLSSILNGWPDAPEAKLQLSKEHGQVSHQTTISRRRDPNTIFEKSNRNLSEQPFLVETARYDAEGEPGPRSHTVARF